MPGLIGYKNCHIVTIVLYYTERIGKKVDFLVSTQYLFLKEVKMIFHKFFYYFIFIKSKAPFSFYKTKHNKKMKYKKHIIKMYFGRKIARSSNNS